MYSYRGEAGHASLARLHTSINDHLTHWLDAQTQAPLLQNAMRHALLPPAKRLRPILMLAAAEAFGLPAAGGGLVAVACALELIHAASLIVDDLPCMDDAPERRGRAAVHVAFGQEVAILAAITLLSQAYGMVAASDLPAAARCSIVAVMAHAAGHCGLAGGQLDDLRPDAAGCTIRAEQVDQLKTGVMFEAAVKMAAAAAGTAPDPLLAFATAFGLAFQLRDDLMDVGNDTTGRANLVLLIGAHGAASRLGMHVASMRALLGTTPASNSLAALVDTVFGPAQWPR